MWNPAGIGAAGGMAGGGILGQMGDILSAPRRMSWDLAAKGMRAMGVGDGIAPRDGADLLSQTFGMDPGSPWTQGLGIGAEMALDPLTYAGSILGGPMGKMWGLASGQEAALGSHIGALTSARRAAQEGLVARAASEAQTVEKYANQAAELQSNFGNRLPSIAGGMERTYNAYTPEILAQMEASGMGRMNTAGQLQTLGQQIPADARAVPIKTQLGGPDLYGSMLDIDPGAAGAARHTLPIDGFGVDLQAHGAPSTVYQRMQPLLPDELNFLRQRTADELGNGTLDGASKWRQLGEPTSPYQTHDLMRQFAHEQAMGANATRPMPSLAQAMGDMGHQGMGQLPPELLSAPLPGAFDMAQKNLARAIAMKKSMQLNNLDYAAIAGAAGAGSYAGGMMGFQGGSRG